MKAEDKITISSLPRLGDLMAIARFAASFNGYEHYGSAAECLDAVMDSSRNTLPELRNELFYAWRASRHGAGDEFVAKYEVLYPYFCNVLNTERCK